MNVHFIRSSRGPTYFTIFIIHSTCIFIFSSIPIFNTSKYSIPLFPLNYKLELPPIRRDNQIKHNHLLMTLILSIDSISIPSINSNIL